MSDDEEVRRPGLRLVGEEPLTEEQVKEILGRLVYLHETSPADYMLLKRKMAGRLGMKPAEIDAHCARAKQTTPGLAFGAKGDAVVSYLVLVTKQTCTLWQSATSEGYASFERDGHLENHKIDSVGFHHFLSGKAIEGQKGYIAALIGLFGGAGEGLFGEAGEPNFTWRYPTQAELNAACYQISNHARQGEVKDPKIRVCPYQGALWIDLGRQDWKGVRVTADGWDFETRIPAPLIRGDGMQALPMPKPGGSIEELRQFVNLDGSDFVLLCGTTAAIYNVFGDYFTQILCGPAGAAKTTATLVIRALSDPHAIATRRFTGETRDLYHGSSHVIGLENVSQIKENLSDALCAINTGTGFEERKLYNQGVTWMAQLHKPVIINGIPLNLAERSDLIDRSVTFICEHLGERVRSKDMFWQEFTAAAPRLLGVILDGLVGAMRVRRQFNNNNDAAAKVLLCGHRPRFVDGLVWGEAACRTMGFADGEFIEAYMHNRDAGLRWIGENDPVCVGIRGLIAKEGSWQGYPEQLREAIRPYVDGYLPTANWLGRRELPRVIPVLKNVYGIQVTMNKRLEQNDNRNGIIIEGVGVTRGRHFEVHSNDGDDTGGGEGGECLPLPTPSFRRF